MFMSLIDIFGQPTCLFWCLWKEMNDRNFEDNERTMEDIISMFFGTLYFWTTAYVSPLLISFSDFLFCFALSIRLFILYIFCILRGALCFH
jgi:hypothetical protein